MIHSVWVHFLVTAIAILHEGGALALALAATYQLDDEPPVAPVAELSAFGSARMKLNSRQCPTPYIWIQPSWWVKYRRKLTSKVLKRCKFLKGKVPVAGTTCLNYQEGFVCLFGEARCNNVVEPETRCDCTDGIWKCSTVCPNLKCPTNMTVSSGITCDPMVHVVVCQYDEFCCGDTCRMTKYCRCQVHSSSGIAKWQCVSAHDVEPCAKTSLEEAGCPCDRPLDGDKCTADYSCGTACCAEKAYTCKCNNITGVYQGCRKTGIVPGPLETCECANTDGIANIQLSTPLPAAHNTNIRPASTPAPTLLPTVDLGIRFNKVKLNITLGPDDYPISKSTARLLGDSDGASVVQVDCFECTPGVALPDLVRSVGGLPTHPSRNSSSPYWKELREVVMTQRLREQNMDPHTIMPLPKAWWNYTIADVAEAVHDEFPGSHHVTLIQQLLKEGAKIDRSIIPSESKIEFLRGPVMLGDLNTWAIGTVGPLNFGVKWYAGR